MLLLLGAALQSVGAHAAATDPLIEGAKLCTRHLPRYEREYGIPTHLLSAIASTESGRYHDGLKIRVPWPWTINAEGKGYYFDSKSEAIAAARKLRARGVQSMDVGCMQVNLHHHAQAFSSLEQAFEPESNIAYAASFLRNLYQEDGSWKKAAGDYHSKTPQRGKEYVGLVYNSWYQIIDKLRSARMSVPSSSVSGLRDMASAEMPPPKMAAAPKQQKVVRLPDERARKIAAYKSPRMNSISVSTRENGVMIVRPDIKVVDAPRPPETITMAEVKSSLPPVAAEPGAKIIRLDNNLLDRRPVNADPIKKSGPNFIFSD